MADSKITDLIEETSIVSGDMLAIANTTTRKINIDTIRDGLATTSANTFTGTQAITGDVNITGNQTVNDISLKQGYSPIYTLTDAVTITPDFDNGSIQKVTLGGDRTIANPSNLNDGATYILMLIQDGTGSRTITWGANYKFSSAIVPILTTTASKTDIISFISDGTYLYGVAVNDY